MSQEARQVEQLVAAIDALGDLSRPGVEDLLGVKLVRFDEDPRNTEAHLPAGPFRRVVLHEPDAGGREPWMLGLEVREGVELHRKAFDNRFLGPIVDINPEVPPEGTVTRGIVGGGRRRVLAFTADSERLQRATFHREQESRS